MQDPSELSYAAGQQAADKQRTYGGSTSANPTAASAASEVGHQVERLAAAELGGEWGGMTTGIVTIPAGTDLAGLLRGLPDDQCPCPHWGYVIAGQLIVRYADHEEVIAAGEAYYLPPGHVPEYGDDTEVFEVSPTEELNKVIEVAVGNLGPAGWSCPLPGAESS